MVESIRFGPTNLKSDHVLPYSICLGSVVGPVIQATGRTDFEDGSRTMPRTVEVRNDLHSVCIKPEVNMAGPLGPTITLGAV